MEIEEEALPPSKGSKTTGVKGSKNGKAGSRGNKVSSPTEAEKAMSGQPEKRRSLAVEEKYQKMTQREHIIKRPDTYSMMCRFCLLCSWFC